VLAICAIGFFAAAGVLIARMGRGPRLPRLAAFSSAGGLGLDPAVVPHVG